MITEEQVRESLEKVLIPGAMRSIVDLNLIREVAVSDNWVKVTLSSAALNSGTQDWIKTKMTEVLDKLPDINKVETEFTEAKPKELNKIGHTLAVMSGKGGVGKSLVAGLAAIALKRQGYEVGILDADITAPSITTSHRE